MLSDPNLRKCRKKIKLRYSAVLTLLKVKLNLEFQVFQMLFLCPFQLKSVLFLLVEVSIGLTWEDTGDADGSMRCPGSYCSRTDFRDSGRKDFPFPISAIFPMSAVLILSLIKGPHVK